MRIYAGTSGFSYKQWKGPFYPEDLSQKKMLTYYASQLPAVEMNNTFYRFPRASLFEGWAEQTPGEFRFAVKAPQSITHRRRLRDCVEMTQDLYHNGAALAGRLGCVLFQLPPTLAKDLPLLQDFLGILPEGAKAAFEFRHATWFDDEVFEALKQRNATLCVAETEDGVPEGGQTPTADWGYLRLRREDYTEADLNRWRQWIGEQPWQEAFVFFKHEDEGAAPRLARAFLET